MKTNRERQVQLFMVAFIVFLILAVTCNQAISQTKCFLIGTQQGWQKSEYQITTDSLVVDSLFKANNLKAWKILSRDSVFIYKTKNSVIYAEYGTFIKLNNGKKEFNGSSNRKYWKKKYK